MSSQTVRIAFTGPMKSGKTTAANYVAHQLGMDSGWQILSFADGVKLEAFDVYPCPVSPFMRYTPESKIALVNDYKDHYRPFLQKLGEERRAQNCDYWVDQLNYRLCLAEDKGLATLVVDDCRYPNEHAFLKKQGFITVKLVPDTYDHTTTHHPSEMYWFDLETDFTICKRMARSLNSFYSQLDTILKKIA